MMKLVQHLNLAISTVNGHRGWADATVQIAELTRNDKGHWIATEGTIEILPLHCDGDLVGHYVYNEARVPVDLASHIQAINKVLEETLTAEMTTVVNYKGKPYEKLSYELRSATSADCQQADGQVLRVWPVWMSDTPITDRNPQKLRVRIFAQYAAATKRTGFL